MSARPDLTGVFAPSSIAVVGASPDIGKPGGRCLRFLIDHGFSGPIYPVNGRYQSIADLPAYPDLESIGAPVDQVILLVPAAAVPDFLERAGRLGARSAVVCSSGFREAGAEGAALEDRLVEVAREHGLAVVGPNSLGVLDLNRHLAATFSTALQEDFTPTPGSIAFVSQSGAMGAAIFALAQRERIGFGTFVSTGNEAVLEFADYLVQFAGDPGVSLVLGYIEGVRDGRRLVAAARAARRAGKVTTVLKVGRTEAGQQAARSHTGAMSGSAEVYEAAFRRAGIVTAESPRQLLDLAIALEAGGVARGPRVGIVSMSGGAAVLTADRCVELGLRLPRFAEPTLERLRAVLPAFAGMANPVDYGGIYGDPEAILATVQAVVEAPEIDQVIVFIGISPKLAGLIEARLAAIAAGAGKPLLVGWLAGPPSGIVELRRQGVPAYDDPLRAAEVAARLWQAGAPLVDDPAPEVDAERARGLGEWLDAARRAGRDSLAEREVKELLLAYGIPCIWERLARDEAEAALLAAGLEGLLAVKAEAPELVHKSDVGAVRLGVAPADAGAAFREVVDAARAAGAEPAGVLIQPMARPGIELLAGMRWDAQFGPVVVVGMGGLLSEVMRDVAIELAPISSELALDMLARLRGASILRGHRGRPGADLAAVAELLVALGRFAIECGGRVSELDLNPVVAYPPGEGCMVLDAAAVLAPPGEVA